MGRRELSKIVRPIGLLAVATGGCGRFRAAASGQGRGRRRSRHNHFKRRRRRQQQQQEAHEQEIMANVISLQQETFVASSAGRQNSSSSKCHIIRPGNAVIFGVLIFAATSISCGHASFASVVASKTSNSHRVVAGSVAQEARAARAASSPAASTGPLPPGDRPALANGITAENEDGETESQRIVTQDTAGSTRRPDATSAHRGGGGGGAARLAEETRAVINGAGAIGFGRAQLASAASAGGQQDNRGQRSDISGKKQRDDDVEKLSGDSRRLGGADSNSIVETHPRASRNGRPLLQQPLSGSSSTRGVVGHLGPSGRETKPPAPLDALVRAARDAQQRAGVQADSRANGGEAAKGSMPVYDAGGDGSNRQRKQRRRLLLSGQQPETPTSDNDEAALVPTSGGGGRRVAPSPSRDAGREHGLHEQDFEKRLMEWKQKYEANRAISDKAYYILLVIYSLFILVGTVCNSLICLTVILKPKILSPRNIFIVNLAGSDLLLCVFTMPFSFIEISMKMWQMGLIPCKLVAGLQATSIFVSTISITAIALDRYKVIVYPTHQETNGSTRRAALLLASVWFGALLLSSPLFQFRTVEHVNVKLPSVAHKYGTTIKAIDFCIEDWPLTHGRGIYSVISMMFQYVLPITIVSVVYAKISDKLKKRLIRRQRLTQLECQQKRQLSLIRRTHTMLISVSLIFGLSWLPLNLLNVVGDFTDLFKGDDQLFRVVFAICHLIGCSSACSNPILYGYLNENFRKEFHQVYTHHMRRLMRLCSGCSRGGAGGRRRRRCQSSGSNYMQPNASSTTTTRSSSGSSLGAAAGADRDRDREARELKCEQDIDSEEDYDLDDDDDDGEEEDDGEDSDQASSANHRRALTGESIRVQRCNSAAAQAFKSAAANAAASRSTSCQHLFPLLAIQHASQAGASDDNDDPNGSSAAAEYAPECNNSQPTMSETDHNNNESTTSHTAGVSCAASLGAQAQAKSRSQAGAATGAKQPESCLASRCGGGGEGGLGAAPADDSAAAERRCSYQTTTSSGHQPLGLTMRFCLCLSGTSSTETLGGNQQQQIKQNKQSDNNPLNHHQQPSHRCRASLAGEQLHLVDMARAVSARKLASQANGQSKQVVALEDDHSRPRGKRSRRAHNNRKWSRKWPPPPPRTQTPAGSSGSAAGMPPACECKCHGHGQSADGMISSTLERLTSAAKLKVGGSARSPTTSSIRHSRLLSDGGGGGGSSALATASRKAVKQASADGDAAASLPKQGRRVWLRFLPAGRVKQADAICNPQDADLAAVSTTAYIRKESCGNQAPDRRATGSTSGGSHECPTTVSGRLSSGLARLTCSGGGGSTSNSAGRRSNFGGGAGAQSKHRMQAGRRGRLCKHCASSCKQQGAPPRKRPKQQRQDSNDAAAAATATTARPPGSCRASRRKTAAAGAMQQPGIELDEAQCMAASSKADGGTTCRGAKPHQIVGTYYLSIETARSNGSDRKRAGQSSELSREHSTSVLVLGASDLEESIASQQMLAEPIAQRENANTKQDEDDHHDHTTTQYAATCNTIASGGIASVRLSDDSPNEAAIIINNRPADNECDSDKANDLDPGKQQPLLASKQQPPRTPLQQTTCKLDMQMCSIDCATSGQQQQPDGRGVSKLEKSVTCFSPPPLHALKTLPARWIANGGGDPQIATQIVTSQSASPLASASPSSEHNKAADWRAEYLSSAFGRKSRFEDRRRKLGHVCGVRAMKEAPTYKPSLLVNTISLGDLAAYTNGTIQMEPFSPVTQNKRPTTTMARASNDELWAPPAAGDTFLSNEDQVHHKCIAAQQKPPNGYIICLSASESESVSGCGSISHSHSSSSSSTCTCSGSSLATSTESTSSCQLNSASIPTTHSPTICSSLAALAGSILQLSNSNTQICCQYRACHNALD